MGVIEPKVPDPSEKDLFQNHRAGYGDDAFWRAMRIAKNGGTLAAGEGAAIIRYFEDQITSNVKMMSTCYQVLQAAGVPKPPEHEPGILWSILQLIAERDILKGQLEATEKRLTSNHDHSYWNGIGEEPGR